MRRPAYILAVVLPAALAMVATPAAAATPASYVNPFNGTLPGAPDFGTGGGAGNTFPGPVVPFGMIQWGPDTSPSSTNVGGGYSYGDSKIRGFSVRRLSGAGCPNGGDFPIMPTTAPITRSPVKPLSTEFDDAFVPAFSHDDEEAAPGYYRVGLDPTTKKQIDAQLTATTRAGIGRFTYPAVPSASMLINATGSRTGNRAGSVQIDPGRQEVTGSAATGGVCFQAHNYKIYLRP